MVSDQLLRDLATKLGTTTEYLWHVLIRHEVINALGSFLGVGLFIFLFYVGAKVPKWVEVWDDDFKGFYWIIYSAACFLMTIVSIYMIVLGIQTLVYPEGAALREIMRLTE